MYHHDIDIIILTLDIWRKKYLWALWWKWLLLSKISYLCLSNIKQLRRFVNGVFQILYFVIQSWNIEAKILVQDFEIRILLWRNLVFIVVVFQLCLWTDRVWHKFRDKHFWPCTLGQEIFLETLITKFVGTYLSYRKYIYNFPPKFMIKNLEFQIYSEKSLKRPQWLFYAKEAVNFFFWTIFFSKMTKTKVIHWYFRICKILPRICKIKIHKILKHPFSLK